MNLSYNRIALIILLTTTTSVTVLAKDLKGECCCKPHCCSYKLQDGLYLGVQGGWDSYRIHNEFNDSTPTTPPTLIWQGNPVVNAQGPVLGAYAGAGLFINKCYYVGVEALGNFSWASTSHTTTLIGPITHYTDVGSNGNWALSILPGYRLSDAATAYLRLGFTQAQMTYTERLTIGGIEGTSRNHEKWVNGIAYGFGIESVICDCWSMRADFIHSNYNGTSEAQIAFPGGAVAGPGGQLFPSDNEFTLGLTYHFSFSKQ